MTDDKRLDPNQKKRWGTVLGADGIARMANKTVGETGGVDTVLTEPKDEGAVKNGGGKDSKAKKETETK